ncbi:MAG: C1 family peptidase [PVC group bacterium]
MKNRTLHFIVTVSSLLLAAHAATDPVESSELEQIQKAIAEKGLYWTATNYGRTFSLGELPGKTPARTGTYARSGIVLPLFIDWRENGGNFVSPVKDQKTCSSCWAFAAVGAMESAIAIAGGIPGIFYDLSEQILVSCCWRNDGCQSGSTEYAADFLFTDGAYYEACFPYTASDQPCDEACPDWRGYAFLIDDYQPIDPSLDGLKAAVYLFGPVQVTMDVYSDFSTYQSGVYEYASGYYTGGHAVILIGYQDIPGYFGGGYFICKNSWGENWGEGGFFRIGYSQVGKDMRFGDNGYIYYYAGTGTSPSPTPEPTPGQTPAPTPPMKPGARNDFNGDGTSDTAVFRPGTGIWAVRGISRCYFGGPGDLPVPGDYDGDRTTDIGLFRPGAGLWAVRGISRCYFGSSGDVPVPGDYDGDGSDEIALFRPSTGLWATEGKGRVYFGGDGDTPVAGDYNGDGTTDRALFRDRSGLWAVRGISRCYFGGLGVQPVPGDYTGDGRQEPAVFKRASGLWAVRGEFRTYFGGALDRAVPGDYTGGGSQQPGIFRSVTGLWALRGVTRFYYGRQGDLPVVE